MRFALITALAAFGMAAPASADMTLSFEWGDIPACNTGRPNSVGNPAFVLQGVPEGTTRVEFRLKDLNAPNYRHGGGTLKMSGSGKVPFGLFKYKSPCPPGRVHTYEWTAIAKKGNTVLERATAQRKYPE